MCEVVSKNIAFFKKQHCFPKNPLFSQKSHCFPTCALFYPIVLKRKIITEDNYQKCINFGIYLHYCLRVNFNTNHIKSLNFVGCTTKRTF